jgi:hypothetical protein
MSAREDDLRRQLDEANKRIERLENARPLVIVEQMPAPRNALQMFSDWWHGGAGQGARTRYMRVNY